MEYKKDIFDTENIPDYALQPAKPAEEFDPTVYEKLYAAMTQQGDGALLFEETEPAAEYEPKPEELPYAEMVSAEVKASDTVNTEQTETVPVSAEEPEAAPVSYTVPEEEAASVEEEITAPVVAQEVKSDSEDAVPAAVPKAAPVRIMPAGKSQINKSINYTDFCKLPPITVYVEEDILVPDIKPDLENILCVEGKCGLAERNVRTGASGIQVLRVSGDIALQTVYKAEKSEDCPSVEFIESKLHFREDCPVKASPNGSLTLSANLESIEHERINERKFRIKAAIRVCIREYRSKEMKLFNKIEGEEVQSLEDRIRFTDVALCKSDRIEISEELKLKDGAPEIDGILCYNANIVENHKQISREKAVVNAAVFCNIMYQSGGCPVLYQGKTEFTQFVKMDDEYAFSRPFTGSRVTFDITDLKIVPKENDEGKCCKFALDMDVDTALEYYCEIEEPIITDLYHYSKEVRYDTDSVEFMDLCGNGAAETTVREIINIPERFSTGFQVVYISGKPVIRREQTDHGKCVVEGVIPLYLVCTSGEDEKTPFCLQQDLSFRSSMDIPGCRPDMEADSHVTVKELWHDQINSRQIEVNASLGVFANVFGKNYGELIQTVSFVESDAAAAPKAGIVVYVAKDGDNIWKIAKKYRISRKQIEDVNDLEDTENIRAGTKLLIVK